MACPVQANKARPANIQSTLPSKLTVVIDVLEGFVDMSAVIGLVAETCW